MTTEERKNPLSREVAQRIDEFGIARAEFARRSGVSRQTIYNIEVLGWTSLRPTTYAILDKYLRWQPGTAYALATERIDKAVPLEPDECIYKIRWRIIERLETLSVDDLTMVLTVMTEMENAWHNNDPLTTSPLPNVVR